MSGTNFRKWQLPATRMTHCQRTRIVTYHIIQVSSVGDRPRRLPQRGSRGGEAFTVAGICQTPHQRCQKSRGGGTRLHDPKRPRKDSLELPGRGCDVKTCRVSTQLSQARPLPHLCPLFPLSTFHHVCSQRPHPARRSEGRYILIAILPNPVLVTDEKTHDRYRGHVAYPRGLFGGL